MDPLSILTGALALVEITGITVKKLHHFKRAYKTYESEIDGLANVVSNLQRSSSSVASFCKANEDFLRQPTGFRLQYQGQHVADIAENIDAFFKEATTLIDDLNALVAELQGDPVAKHRLEKLDKVKKVLRMESREDEMKDIRVRIRDCYDAIQLSMTALNLASIQAARESNKASIEGAEEKITDDISRLKLELFTKLAEVSDIVAEKASAATKISTSLEVNQYFEVSQTVTSHFTGRNDLLAELKRAFQVHDPSYNNPSQRRFVVSGVAGSGKSQFACRFAADVRNYFWGVFLVDASSPETAENDFGKIAKCADSGATSMQAAKEWLASRRTPWLLIIDGADKINVEDYFPGGSYGCILVTTRNPALQALGTVGKEFFHFDELKHEDAHALLLRAAAVKMPCTEQTILQAAQQISEKMCYLPLALNYAGMTIRQRLCGWADYLLWYKNQQRKVGRTQRQQKVTDFQRSEKAVFHNFEALLQNMVDIADADPNADLARTMRDAMDLLNLFAFFHHRDIRLDMLLQCIDNPHKEREIQFVGTKQPTRPGARKALSKRMVDTFEKARGQVFYKRLFDPKLVLPPVLRDYCDAPKSEREKAEFRIREALLELSSRSLISDPGKECVFSIHPLIHSFCRDRLGDANEGLWCEAAQITLARCVVIEEKLFTGGNSDFFNPRELLPHVDYARRVAQELRERFSEKWKNRAFIPKLVVPRPNVGDLPPPNDPARWIRFSVIYSQCLKIQEAYRLQKPIRDMSVKVRGIDHDVSIRLSLAVAITNNWLGNFKECVKMQKEAVTGCIELYGVDSPATLRYQDGLGMMLLAAGRLKGASKNLRHARDRLMTHPDRGPMHKDTLNALSHVGMIEVRYFRPEIARDLCEKAVAGLQRTPDAEEDLLDAKQNLAMALNMLGGKHLETAYKLQDEVFTTRINRQGNEHPLTLIAGICLSRVLIEQGENHKAEMLLTWGLKIGIRDFTEEHYGVLAAQSTLARVYEAQGKVDKAEKLFADVNTKLLVLRDRHEHDHLDRIGHLWYWLKFEEGQSRWERALEIHAELLTAIETVAESYTSEKPGKQHKMHEMLIEKRPQLLKALEEQRREKSDGADSSGMESPPPVYKSHESSRQSSIDEKGQLRFRRAMTS